MDEKRLIEIKERVYSEVGNRKTNASSQDMKYDRQVLVCGVAG